MIKRLFFWAMALVVALVMPTSCKDNNDIVDEPLQPEELTDYTIIYYGHGGGNLDPMLLENMAQFFQADENSYKNVNICAQYKYSSAENINQLISQLESILDPNMPEIEEIMTSMKEMLLYANKTCRFTADDIMNMLSNSEDPDTEFDNPLKIFGRYIFGPDNADISCPDSLTNFINWAATVRPAKKYILVLSDHGSGYLPHEEMPETTRGVIYDDGHENKSFTAKTLTQAIRNANVRPSVIYFDACLMNTAEYQFEMAPLTDYLVQSTFIVPGEGGDYVTLIDALSQNPDDLEKALTRFCQATVDRWDESASEGSADDAEEPVYHDMNVYRASDIDALGTELRTFVDKLIDTYQNGSEEMKAKIDTCTAHAFRIDENRPFYDLIDYAATLTISLPDVFGSAVDSKLGKAFDRCIVYQQSSKWLLEYGHAVDLSVMLGCEGHYRLNTGLDNLVVQFFDNGVTGYIKDGNLIIPSEIQTKWGTLDQSYGQLRFDQATGWSRWLRLNKQEPNQQCFTGFNPVIPYTNPD